MNTLGNNKPYKDFNNQNEPEGDGAISLLSDSPNGIRPNATDTQRWFPKLIDIVPTQPPANQYRIVGTLIAPNSINLYLSAAEFGELS